VIKIGVELFELDSDFLSGGFTWVIFCITNG